jgi:hypothetical protein
VGANVWWISLCFEKMFEFIGNHYFKFSFTVDDKKISTYPNVIDCILRFVKMN